MYVVNERELAVIVGVFTAQEFIGGNAASIIQLFASGGQSIGTLASASVPPKNIQH